MNRRKAVSFTPLLKALAELNADMHDAAEQLGVELPRYEPPKDMDAIVQAFQELEVDAAAQRCRQILEQAGRDLANGRMAAMDFMAIEQRLKTVSDAINHRAARLAIGGN